MQGPSCSEVAIAFGEYLGDVRIVLLEIVAPSTDRLIDQDAFDNPGRKCNGCVAQNEEWDVGRTAEGLEGYLQLLVGILLGSPEGGLSR